MKDSQLKVNVDPALHQELKAHCADRGLIMGHFVERAIIAQLHFEQNLDLKQKPKKEKRK